MKCDHEHDDGAYVLGALSPAERAAYERHLSTCSFCREAVAEIAVLPGLLGRLDPADVAELSALTAPAERSPVPDLVTAASSRRRRERRTRRWTYGTGAALLAACLAVVVGLGVPVWRDGPVEPDVQLVAMQPVASTVPVTAQIGMHSTAWGTEITMKCAYQRTGNSTRAYTFRLVAYGPDDTSEQIGSWIAAPGAQVEMKGATRFSGAELVRVELLRYDGTPLLSYDVR